jgi:uncharacterized protein YecE (DUF72 family)
VVDNGTMRAGNVRLRVGTSGYSYKEWKGSFYPRDLPAARMLTYYAQRFDTVEINNTFYRMPSEKTVVAWDEQVPEGFRFVLKATRRITHHKRLQEAGDELAHLVRVASVLGDKLGPTLFQLPPHLKKDLARLRDFLALLPAGWRAAFEFRSPSWFTDDVYRVLRERNAALVLSDVDGAPRPAPVPTADFGYLRLRRAGYGSEDLRDWTERIFGQPWNEAWVFFKHEDEGAGPRLAAQFLESAAAVPDAGQPPGESR